MRARNASIIDQAQTVTQPWKFLRNVFFLRSAEVSDKGLVPPSFTATERDNISLPKRSTIIWCLTDEELQYYDGSAWRSFIGDLVAGDVDELSDISADLGDITAGTVTGVTFQTDSGATSGIKMDGTSLRGYSGGNVVFELTTTGTFSMTGGTITGGIFQTHSSGTQGVKLTEDGLYSWDSSNTLRFDLDASTGYLTLWASLGAYLLKVDGDGVHMTGPDINGTAAVENIDVSGVYKIGGTEVLVAQGAHVADADSTTIVTQFNTLLSRLEGMKLLASS